MARPAIASTSRNAPSRPFIARPPEARSAPARTRRRSTCARRPEPPARGESGGGSGRRAQVLRRRVRAGALRASGGRAMKGLLGAFLLVLAIAGLAIAQLVTQERLDNG